MLLTTGCARLTLAQITTAFGAFACVTRPILTTVRALGTALPALTAGLCLLCGTSVFAVFRLAIGMSGGWQCGKPHSQEGDERQNG